MLDCHELTNYTRQQLTAIYYYCNSYNVSNTAKHGVLYSTIIHRNSSTTNKQLLSNCFNWKF